MSDRQENVIEEISMVEVRAFLSAAYKQNKHLPSIKEVAEQFQVSEYRMNEIFRILVHEGFLKRNYSRYKMPDKAIALPLLKIPESVKSTTDPELITPELQITDTWVLTVMRIILGIVGLGAIGVSIYYTSVWLIEYLPIFGAIFLASIMVVFSTLAFEVVILLFKAGRWLLGAGFVVLFITVLAFSMLSTIAGQYNQRLIKENVVVVAESDTTLARAGYNLLLKQEGQIQNQIEDQQAIRIVYQNLFNAYDIDQKEIDLKGFRSTKAQLDNIDKLLMGLNKQLLTNQTAQSTYLTQAKGPGALQETVINKESFFDWVSRLLKNRIQADMIQFYFSVFPAVFVDLIAPFALAFALFQQKSTPTKKRNSEKNKKHKIFDFFSKFRYNRSIIS
jgi:hypothetical protein